MGRFRRDPERFCAAPLDAHRGLTEAIGATLPGASWQRSSVNMMCGGMVPLVHLRRRERTLATRP